MQWGNWNIVHISLGWAFVWRQKLCIERCGVLSREQSLCVYRKLVLNRSILELNTKHHLGTYTHRFTIVWFVLCCVKRYYTSDRFDCYVFSTFSILLFLWFVFILKSCMQCLQPLSILFNWTLFSAMASSWSEWKKEKKNTKFPLKLFFSLVFLLRILSTLGSKLEP